MRKQTYRMYCRYKRESIGVPKRMNKIELLAPAGSLEALKVACECGADAVYFGGTKYSARANAGNLTDEEITEGIRYAHIRGVKIYITINTLVFDREMEAVINYIDFLVKADVDAVIIQDMGLANRIREEFPELDIHASTQMTIHDINGAKLLKDMGFKRIVLARELSLEEVISIKNKVGIEVEVFGHGALCISWSGQCLMSSMIGGRSGNRGKCAQPCRKKYNSSFSLSTKDLNTIDFIDELIKSGVTSLKIEGRMKNSEYVAVTIFNYRTAIDAAYSNSEFNTRLPNYELEATFNREFTKGYLLKEKRREIVSADRSDNRGILLGNVVNQKGNFLRIKLENNFLCDGDGIEIQTKKRETW